MRRDLVVLTHATCLEHDPGPGHPEAPARLRAVQRHLREGPLAARVRWEDAEPADPGALARVHSAAHLERLERMDARGGGALDPDTVLSARSLEAARRAAGACIAAARTALDGTPAFAAVRPPGHHATRERGMGFCLLNGVAAAARTATDAWGLARVLIVDWDVHHGNGTQDIVERDPRIRYVSLHQWPLYPGTGREDERGVGNIFNVPRPPGRPRAEYVRDLDRAVARATEGWAPDLVLISAGFDAMRGDPLGGFPLEPEDYATWTAGWRALGAPIASVLEGGYAPERVAQGVAAHLEAL